MNCIHIILGILLGLNTVGLILRLGLLVGLAASLIEDAGITDLTTDGDTTKTEYRLDVITFNGCCLKNTDLKYYKN